MSLSTWRVRSLSGYTMLIFGVLAVILGVVGIINPETTLSLLAFELTTDRSTTDFTLTFITASSMASFNMGVYYILAALTNWKPFFWWTVPFRMVTFTVFLLTVVRGIAPAGFIGVAIWELVGALATGGALLYERNRES